MTSLPLAERCYRALLYRSPTSTAAAAASAATSAQLDKALFLSAHRPQVGEAGLGAEGGLDEDACAGAGAGMRQASFVGLLCRIFFLFAILNRSLLKSAGAKKKWKKVHCCHIRGLF